MAEPLAPIKVRMGALTGRQVQAIERAVGLPMSRWDERASDVDLAAALRSAIEGRPAEEYLDHPATDLLASVVLDDDEGEDDDPGNG